MGSVGKADTNGANHNAKTIERTRPEARFRVFADLESRGLRRFRQTLHVSFANSLPEESDGSLEQGRPLPASADIGSAAVVIRMGSVDLDAVTSPWGAKARTTAHHVTCLQDQ